MKCQGFWRSLSLVKEKKVEQPIYGLDVARGDETFLPDQADAQ